MVNIVLIGDVMLDISIMGSVTRIAPEAPIGIIAESSRRETLGGAGNVYANLIGAGESPYFVTIVGDDESGEKVGNMVESGSVIMVPGRKTTTKTRVYAYTRHIKKEVLITRIDRESAEPYNLTVLNDDKVKAADYIVFSDYNKGLITEAMINYVRSVNQHAKFIGDTKNFSSIFSGFYIMTPSEFDLQKTFGDDPEATIKRLHSDYNIIHPIITLGDKGVMYMDEDGEVKILPATKDRAVDVTGAGDTFVAYLVSALSHDTRLVDAIRFAIMAAGVKVTKEGTYAVRKDEVFHE